jgi:hydrogenase maturation protease
MTAPLPAAVVIGLGNVVMSDDGVGVHVVRRLRERNLLDGDVEVIEGGTAGLLLLPHLADARRAIIVDAIDCGAPAGRLVRLTGDDWSTAFARYLTPHDVGPRDLLGAARLTGSWPEELVLHGVQPASVAIGTELSPPVAAALDPLIAAVLAELRRWEADGLTTDALSSPRRR